MTRRLVLFLAALVAISPIFGVWLAELLGYHEPLDIAVELINEAAGYTLLRDLSEEWRWSPFADYKVPGLPDWVGYIVSGFIGLMTFFILHVIIKRLYVKRAS